MDGNGSNRFLFYGTKVGTNTTYDDVFFSMRNNSESWTACKTKKKSGKIKATAGVFPKGVCLKTHLREFVGDNLPTKEGEE